MKYTRKCPSCDKILFYKTKQNAFQQNLKKAVCRQCSNKVKSENMKGEKNHFYSHHHSGTTCKLLSELNVGRAMSDETKEKIKKSTSGRKNHMFGKSVYEIWLKKYGKEIADNKMIELKKIQSKNSSGKNNPMYGRPSPHGSGNGWKCWYKNIFFRSLRELSFFLNFIEKNNLFWEKGEQIKFRIKYTTYDKKERNYYPDFVIGNHVYECKPIKLWNTPLIQAKKEAAEKFCKDLGMEYHLVDTEPIPEQINQLYESGAIIFLEGYAKKFENFYKN